jgi:hypothetical protein
VDARILVDSADFGAATDARVRPEHDGLRDFSRIQNLT